MALVQKKSQPTASASDMHPTPDIVMTALPSAVLQRFPELKEWQETNDARWQTFMDVLDRRQAQTDEAIAALTARVVALE